MIIMVDERDYGDRIEGFQFTNKSGKTEGVRLYPEDSKTYFRMETAIAHVDYYFEDIPKLIKALEATYKHYQDRKVGK